MSWGSEKLLIRCGRESLAEGVLGSPDELGIRDVGDDVVGKATLGRRGPRNPQWSFGEQLEIRCSKESHHPAESWAPGPPVEQPWRTRKTKR